MMDQAAAPEPHGQGLAGGSAAEEGRGSVGRGDGGGGWGEEEAKQGSAGEGSARGEESGSGDLLKAIADADNAITMACASIEQLVSVPKP